jgi:2-oxoglutarate ferredoxin oxidoreductase subunit gamma
MRIEVRLAGRGGQGLILAGIILAEGVGVYEGKYVVQTQNYGPEARGGSSRSDVIIADEEIYFPHCRQVSVLACLSQESYNDYYDSLEEGGVILLDEFYVREFTRSPATFVLPFSQMSRKELGRELFANVITLGTISRILSTRYDLCRLESLKEALARRVPGDYLAQNLRALEIGYNLIEKL